MTSRKRHEDLEAHGGPTHQGLVYLPCPECRRGVQLSGETRVASDPETYECPNCSARFYLENSF